MSSLMSVFLSCSTCLRARTGLTARIISIGNLRNVANHSTDPNLTYERRNAPPRRRVRPDSLGSEDFAVQRSLLEKTKLEEYLQHIASTSRQVSLADIERCRPMTSPAVDDPGYEQKYTALSETLVRSFSFNQLEQFLDLYRLNPPAKRNKWHFAVTIIEEAWKWPSLSRTKKDKREWSEIVYESFPLDTRQAFLLLGKDGVDLLALSLKYNIHVSFSANPLSLKVEGLRGSINNVARHLAQFKGSIQEELFTIPHRQAISSDTLQRISRLSGVFIEDIDHGIIRLSKRSTEGSTGHFAKRLLMLAALETTRKAPFLLCRSSIPSGSDATYSLYPFFHPYSSSRVSETGSLFRVRKVREHSNSYSYEKPSGVGLAGSDRILDLFGQQVSLRDILRKSIDTLVTTAHSTADITASFGHLLICPPKFQPHGIVPPGEGREELSNVLGWLAPGSVHRLFVASSPALHRHPHLLDPHLGYRLVYHSLSSQLRENARKPMQMLKFELGLSFPTTITERRIFEAGNGSTTAMGTGSVHEASETNRIGLDSTCWVGNLTELDLMMPDYTMDIRFSLTDGSQLLEQKWPTDFRDYANRLHSYLTGAAEEAEIQPPDPPLVLEHEGSMYGLETCSIVRRMGEPTINPSVYTTTESLRDVSSNQRSTTYQVTCNDLSSDHIWASFLRQCDASSIAIGPKSFAPVETEDATTHIL